MYLFIESVSSKTPASSECDCYGISEMKTPSESEVSLLGDGWKHIRARCADSIISLIISPQGKKFESLQKAQDYMLESVLKRRRKRRNIARPKTEVAGRHEDTPPLAVSKTARFKRKYLEQKNQHLLKRTLERNHIKSASQSHCLEVAPVIQSILRKNKRKHSAGF